MRALWLLLIFAVLFTPLAEARGTHRRHRVLPKCAPEPLVLGRWPKMMTDEDSNKKVFLNKEVLIRVVQLNSYQLIAVYGLIYYPDLPVIREATQALIHGKKTVVLPMFGGGQTGPILELRDAIRAKCPKEQGCSVETQVFSHAWCASNCITLFMMGDIRTATPTAKFGFHAAVLKGKIQSGLVEQIYGSAGIDQLWLSRHSQLFKSTNLTALLPSQLVGSNIYTRILHPAPVKPEPRTCRP